MKEQKCEKYKLFAAGHTITTYFNRIPIYLDWDLDNGKIYPFPIYSNLLRVTHRRYQSCNTQRMRHLCTRLISVRKNYLRR